MKVFAAVLCFALVYVLATVDAKKKNKGASYDDEYAAPEYLEDPHPKYFSYYIPMPAAYGAQPAAYAGYGAAYGAPPAAYAGYGAAYGGYPAAYGGGAASYYAPVGKAYGGYPYGGAAYPY